MNPEPDIQYDPSDGSLNDNINNTNNKNNSNGNCGDDDGDAVDGPTVEAYVDLVKTACKYYLTRYCPICILTYIYSVQSLP